ncbi:MAG: protease complex subunit PrcB family protein [Gemmatimonadota bacterium]
MDVSPPADQTTTALTALLTVAALAACGGTTPTGIPADATLLDHGQLETLVSTDDSDYHEPQRRVIRSPAAWAEAWRQLGRDREAPDVDFGDHMVILAASGTRHSGGHGIAVDSVYRHGGSLFATVREVSPGDSCVVTTALTHPATAVRVPRVEGSVEFVEQEIVAECD